MGNVLILAGDLKNTRKGLHGTQVWNGKSAAQKTAKNGLSRGGMEWLLAGKDPFFVIPEGNVNATMEISTGVYSTALFGQFYQWMFNGRDNGCKMPLEKGMGEAPAWWETLRSNLFS